MVQPEIELGMSADEPTPIGARKRRVPDRHTRVWIIHLDPYPLLYKLAAALFAIHNRQVRDTHINSFQRAIEQLTVLYHILGVV
jgi:hypothetical protein